MSPSFFEFFSGREFAVPLWEVGFMILVNSICLLLGKHKVGLIVSYFFLFYWGFVVNRVHFVDALGNMTMGLYLYATVGIVMVGIIVIAFFVKSER
jgi:hypothetical protein